MSRQFARLLKLVGHGFGKAINLAFLIAKIEAGFGRLSRMPIGPKRVEVGMCLHRPSGVRVVAPAVLRKLSDALPRPSAAFPHRHFAAGVVGLRPRFCGRDDALHAVRFEVERPHVVIAVGRGDGLAVPIVARPLQQRPCARAVFRA